MPHYIVLLKESGLLAVVALLLYSIFPAGALHDTIRSTYRNMFKKKLFTIYADGIIQRCAFRHGDRPPRLAVLVRKHVHHCKYQPPDRMHLEVGSQLPGMRFLDVSTPDPTRRASQRVPDPHRATWNSRICTGRLGTIPYRFVPAVVGLRTSGAVASRNSTMVH